MRAVQLAEWQRRMHRPVRVQRAGRQVWLEQLHHNRRHAGAVAGGGARLLPLLLPLLLLPLPLEMMVTPCLLVSPCISRWRAGRQQPCHCMYFQAHIRTYGAVLTAMDIYEDFFTASARASSCCIVHAASLLPLPAVSSLICATACLAPRLAAYAVRSPERSPWPPPFAPAQVWNSGADTVYHYDGKSVLAGGHAIICFGALLAAGTKDAVCCLLWRPVANSAVPMLPPGSVLGNAGIRQHDRQLPQHPCLPRPDPCRL
jgi:hypothetical protein